MCNDFDPLAAGSEDAGDKRIDNTDDWVDEEVNNFFDNTTYVDEINMSPANKTKSRANKIKCNGSSAWCDLRFDQYTFPSTHNSAAVDLKLDCHKTKGIFGYLCPVLRWITPSVADCLLNNQPKHPISRQLQDGIRAFDMDTCQVGDKAVLCHGSGDLRGLGEDLSKTLETIKSFLVENPNEVVSLEFGDVNGDPVVVGKSIGDSLNTLMKDLLYEQSNPEQKWPTLQEMIEKNKRVVTFFGCALKGLNPRPNWALPRRAYYLSTWNETQQKALSAAQVAHLIKHYCDNNHSNKGRLWHAMDFEYTLLR